jgi:hypothetical protein
LDTSGTVPAACVKDLSEGQTTSNGEETPKRSLLFFS